MFKEIINLKDSDIDQLINSIRSNKESSEKNISKEVKKIIEKVSKEGDEAIIDYINKFESKNISSLEEIKISKKEIRTSEKLIKEKVFKALKRSYERVFNFQKSLISPKEGTRKNLTRLSVPIESVLIYAPGGKASYPSTVLMAAAPARAAGVRKIFLASPSKNRSLNAAILTAANISNIDEVFCLGGAQAIAGFAFSNNSLPTVDKIVGPGNKYVTEAKKQVFGKVGIDLIAGPSEILIIADKHSDPFSTALDLMAQAEHDELACSILISLDKEFSLKVLDIISSELKKLERKNIIKESLSNNGYIINVDSLEEAINLSNKLAPEHLHLKLEDSAQIAREFLYAGTILIGEDSANAISDYALGPSHILPTSGSARFSSQLSVNDFMVNPTLVDLSQEEMGKDYIELLEDTVLIAKAEGLSAHSLSAEYRLNKKRK